jgi:hypothetical protein
MKRSHWIIMGAALVFGGLCGVTAQAIAPEPAPAVGQRVDHDVVYVNGVSCPEEDSCMADYDGELGMWVIYVTTP